MPFVNEDYFRVRSEEKNIRITLLLDFGKNALDESWKRRGWGFRYEQDGVSVFSRYYCINVNYPVVRPDGVSVEGTYENIYVIPIDLVLEVYRSSFIQVTTREPTPSDIESFVSDLEEAFRCYARPRIQEAERHVDRKIPFKIIFFNAYEGADVDRPIDWGMVDRKALALLINAGSMGASNGL